MSDYVKPDRMLKRFAESVRDRNVKVSECHQLLLGASLILSETYPEMEARILDHLVWKYQRGRKKRLQMKQEEAFAVRIEDFLKEV